MKCSTLGFITARTTASTAVLAAVFGCGAALAAVPVEDSLFRAAAELDTQTFNNRTSEVDEDQDLWAPASQSTAATSALVGEQPLFYQMQVLQQEVLRGVYVIYTNYLVDFRLRVSIGGR